MLTIATSVEMYHQILAVENQVLTYHSKILSKIVQKLVCTGPTINQNQTKLKKLKSWKSEIRMDTCLTVCAHLD